MKKVCNVNYDFFTYMLELTSGEQRLHGMHGL